MTLSVLGLLQNTLLWFQKTRPEPTTKDFTTQLGVHVEEFGEMLDCFTATNSETYILVEQARRSVHALANHLKAEDDAVRIQPEDRVEFLDSICDQIVTGTGVAHTQRMDILNGLNEVNRSNFSKFDDEGEPIFNPDRKVMKGPGFSKPDLTPYV